MIKKLIFAAIAAFTFTSCADKEDTEVIEPTIDNVDGYYNSDHVRKLESTVNLCGYTYDVTYRSPAFQQYNWYLDEYYDLVAPADFLTRVCSASIGLVDTNKSNESLQNMAYSVTTDLNEGAYGDYSYLAFGGMSYYTARFNYIYTNEWHLGQGNKDNTTITGLRLVSITSDRNNVPEEIVDPVMGGVTWHLVPSYHGSKNLNNKTTKNGDALYLYYTRDYTGRKITVVNPALVDLMEMEDIDYKPTLDDFKFITNLFGGISTWQSSNDNAWNVNADKLIEEAATYAYKKSGVNNISKKIMDHVDFIRLYDRNMEQTFGDDNNRPANFNRNGGGNKIFISYSYISDGEPCFDYCM